MASYAGYIFVIGEEYNQRDVCTQCYNPLTDEWNRKATPPFDLFYCRKSSIFVRNGQLSVIYRLEQSIHIYGYDLAADKWIVSTEND